MLIRKYPGNLSGYFFNSTPMTLSYPKLHQYAVLVLLLITTNVFSQTNSIVMERKGKDRQIVIRENKRIKLTTVDGKKFVGRFSILDDNTIQVKGATISLDSIATLQKHSTFSSIVRPVIILNGVACIVIGIAGAASGGFGYLLTVTMIPIGTPMVLCNVFTNKHRSERWSYRMERTE